MVCVLICDSNAILESPLGAHLRTALTPPLKVGVADRRGALKLAHEMGRGLGYIHFGCDTVSPRTKLVTAPRCSVMTPFPSAGCADDCSAVLRQSPLVVIARSLRRHSVSLPESARVCQSLADCGRLCESL